MKMSLGFLSGLFLILLFYSFAATAQTEPRQTSTSMIMSKQDQSVLVSYPVTAIEKNDLEIISDESLLCEGHIQKYTILLSFDYKNVKWYYQPLKSNSWIPVSNGDTYHVLNNDTYSELKITTDEALQGYKFYCLVVKQDGSTLASNVATLNTNPNTRIISQPISRAICEGTDADFRIKAQGAGTIVYQWQVNKGHGYEDLPGNNSNILHLRSVSIEMNQYRYRCIITSSCGQSETSDEIIPTVNPKPFISGGKDMEINKGEKIKLSAQGGLNYQWNNEVTDNVSFAPEKTTIYTVTGYNEYGCSSSDQVVVIVRSLSKSPLEGLIDEY